MIDFLQRRWQLFRCFLVGSAWQSVAEQAEIASLQAFTHGALHAVPPRVPATMNPASKRPITRPLRIDMFSFRAPNSAA